MEESTAIIDSPSGVAVIDEELAAIINAHKEVVDLTWRLMDTGNKFVEKAAVVGRLLIAKKEQLGHGNFLPWLAENIKDFGCRTAQDYMKAARYFGNTKHASHLENGEPLTMRYIHNLRQAVGLLEDKSPSDKEEREKPAFVIRCAFNVDPEKLDEHQRKDAFDQAKPLLQAFEAFGFIEIKA